MAEKKEHHAVTQYVEGLQTLLASIRNDNDVAGGLWIQLKDAHQQFYHDSMLRPHDDIDVTLPSQAHQTPQAAATPPKINKRQHNVGCRELKLALGRLAYVVRCYMPVLASTKQQLEAEKDRITNQVPEEFRQQLLEPKDSKLEDNATQQKQALDTCFMFLEKEEAAREKIVESSAGKDGFDSVPVFEQVVPLDERKREVELSNAEENYDYVEELAKIRQLYQTRKQNQPASKSAKKGGAKRAKRGREPGTGTKFVVGDVVKVLWGSGKKRGYYPAQIVDNKGGYKVQYLDDDGELIADEIEENVVVTRIRRPKKRPKKAGEEPPESDEEAD